MTSVSPGIVHHPGTVATGPYIVSVSDPRDPAADRLAALREEYTLGGLSEAEVPPAPVPLLRRWMDDAIAADLRDPTAMVLSTVSAGGRPSSRIVLCKGLSEQGLDFYTSYASRKAEELSGQAFGAVVFPWHPLQRQVRVEGRVDRLGAAESDAYFASRPRPSQLGAWASPQSRVVASRAALDERYAAAEARFEGVEVSRPPFWGGYRLVPEVVEFWQGRTGRLHDRLRFRQAPAAGHWLLERLGP